MALSKLSEVCKAYQNVYKCDHKRMELCALAELHKKAFADAVVNISENAAAPILRERIESPLSPYAYRDELEKALNDYHFGSRFMMYGV